MDNDQEEIIRRTAEILMQRRAELAAWLRVCAELRDIDKTVSDTTTTGKFDASLGTRNG